MKRTYALYSCLAVVFAIAFLYQIRFTIDSAPELWNPTAIARPPFELRYMSAGVVLSVIGSMRRGIGLDSVEYRTAEP